MIHPFNHDLHFSELYTQKIMHFEGHLPMLKVEGENEKFSTREEPFILQSLKAWAIGLQTHDFLCKNLLKH